MRAVSRPKYRSRELVDNDFTVARFDENASCELCGDQCRSIDFQPLPIIPIRCQELVVKAAAWLKASCPRKLSVYGTC